MYRCLVPTEISVIFNGLICYTFWLFYETDTSMSETIVVLYNRNVKVAELSITKTENATARMSFDLESERR